MGIDNISDDWVQWFMPHTYERLSEVRAEGDLCFAHYTSAEALLNILRSRQVWFRNAGTMNDFSEVEHGLTMLAEAWESEPGKDLRQLLDGLNDGMVDELVAHHNGWQPTYTEQTYLFAVSEHKHSDADYGRLSMWREYARKSGVALLLNREPFETDTNLLKAYTTPVMYVLKDEFIANFDRIRSAVRDNRDDLAKLDPALLVGAVFQAFRFMALSTKHPGFEEEREWRVIYNPTMESSPYFQERIEVIGGVPQKFYALKLETIESDGQTLDLSPNALVQKVIIGPTLYQRTIGEAIVHALTSAGVEDAGNKVTYSNIPVRT